MIKKLAWIAAIVLLLGILTVVYLFNKPHPSVGSPDYIVTANELIAEFEKDESAASKKYVGRAVEVEGMITDVMEKDNGFLLLLGDSSFVSRVSCTLQDTQGNMAYGLTSGDSITVRGICTGRLLDVVLIDCIIPEK